MFQNNGVLKKVSSKGWCKKSIYKTFVNILCSLLKIILIIVEVPGGGGGGTFIVYIGSVYFLFIFIFCGLGSKFECQYFWRVVCKNRFFFFGQGDFWRCFGGLIKHRICFGCLMSKKGLFLMRFGNF